ncbi:glycosyltransferase [Corynebacterium freiburgense]|uniref:glycosyltransferase n=1 Tax=Corynebacterium freiburgense TaxID=556548 RepID=UPI00047ADFB0|nr:glycosyltransferase [Corynebacterium freiburgense]WJZ03143.1 UDP-D-galactose:(glucosyl)lipopolysaccharide-1,6-D-galactosyltransferase [Corynebacterium freiburgense]
MRVLHVTECLAGGVQTALEGYVKATPEIEHFVVANSRRGENLSTGRVAGCEACLELPTNHIRAIKYLIAAIRKIQPDVIHAHSSFAGVYSRIVALASKTPVVYTPHALAYGRPDFPKSRRLVYRALEKILSKNTKVFAGCSEHESQLLRRLSANTPVVTIPNALPPDHPSATLHWKAKTTHVVGMVGRINDYRDPQRFTEIAKLVRMQNPNVKFIWIGDGDNQQRAFLQTQGIYVTGWLNSIELQRKITELSVLLYTSKWDGFPMVILEAISSKVPTIVADIPPLRECPRPARFSTTEEAAEKVLKELELNMPLADFWDPLIEAHTFENQKKALIRTYEIATS